MTTRALALSALLLVPAAQAAVHFEDWRTSSLQAVADEAAQEKRPLVLVVSQPDWCPPCIRLEKKWLRNPDDTELSSITKDALVVEVNGYDEPEASVLRKHRIAFRGTPTTYVFAPQAPHHLLGDAPMRGSIIGAPDDFPAQLQSLLKGEDAVAELRRKLDQQDETDRVQRAKDMIELGDLLAARGDRAGSYLAYRRLRRFDTYGLSPAQATELTELKRDAAWREADTSMLRVRKNYPHALHDVVAYDNQFVRRQAEVSRTAYAKAWAMANSGDVPGALDVLDRGLTDDADGADTYLYFCFRCADGRALVAGERKAKEAMWRWPDHRASWLEAQGRIERRQGRYADAERSFAEAVSLESDPETKLVYQGELEHVRDEAAEREASASKVATNDAANDEPEHGSDPRRIPAGLRR